ncbi:hypothetical protein HU200_056276 [Digitaria exilis]|uniref:DUF8039 domain-containing protein n=1 Tax=Digitaria exilis TaxID=1010633 RepID=A0A835E5J7_9POAL|nr:hypothetical protein HU200_056276 [Digitaria exilis]
MMAANILTLQVMVMRLLILTLRKKMYPSPASNVPSSVESRELPQSYSVDFITERQPCELHTPIIGNKTKAVAHDVAEVPIDGGVIHGVPILPGYARVDVDKVLPGWEDLDLEIEGGDGEVLGQALHSWICWQKKYIIFPRFTIIESSGQNTGIRSPPTAVTPPEQRSTDTSRSNSSVAYSNGASTTSY